MSKKLYDADWIEGAVDRLAKEVVDSLSPGEELAVVGVRTRGATLAERIHKILDAAGCKAELGYLDTTLYRDDIQEGGGRKAIGVSDIVFDVTGKTVLLVDDIFYTGRTVRAALTELNDFGRPARVRLLCLVDRGGRELPIRPDFVAEQIEVPGDARLRTRLAEIDNEEYIEQIDGDGE